MSIDFFIYYKEIILIVVAAIALLWFVGERFLPDKVDNNVPLLKGNNKWLFVLAGIFTAGTVISTIASVYKKNALWGSPMVGEGLWTLLAYVVLIFTFYNCFANDFGLSMLKKTLTILSGTTVILTLVEWFYKPLLEIGLVKLLVAPAKYAEIVAGMKATTFDSAISLTFHNPGYYGGFVCMLLPFTVFFCLQAQKVKEKLVYGILSVVLLFGVVASNTTTALYIAIIEVVLVLIVHVTALQSKNVAKNKALLQGACVLVITIATLFLSGAITGNSIFSVFMNENSATGNEVEARFEIEDIRIEKNKLFIVGHEATLEIVNEMNQLSFYDENGEKLSPVYEEESLVFFDARFFDLRLSIQQAADSLAGVRLCVVVDAGYQDTVDFFLLDNGMFSGVGQNGVPLENIGDVGTPEGLKQFYGLFTGRGYAWVNSLPILKDTLLIGKGPGNFAYYFKQFDYAGMLNTHETVKKIIDKPHNAYLQYAINEGVPAMIAFFGIFVFALWKSVKMVLKKNLPISNGFVIPGMVAMVGFLMYSMINDSMVTVTPMACMIAGILLANCYHIEHK